MYWARDIDFGIRCRQNQEEWRRLLLGWYSIEVFVVPLAHCAERFLLVLGWCLCSDNTRLLYVSTLQVISYHTGIYKSCCDDNDRLKIIAWTDKALMLIGCFFSACRNGHAWHSFAHVQLDHNRGHILVPSPTVVLKDIEVPGLYYVIRLTEYDPVLFLLAVWRLQDIDWSLYGADNSPFLVTYLQPGWFTVFRHYVPIISPKRVPASFFIYTVMKFVRCKTSSLQASRVARMKGLS